MASSGDSYAKHINILKNAPVVSGAIYLVKSGEWSGTNYAAGTTQNSSLWNYYFADITTQIGKTLYYGFQNSSTLGGIAFLNVYGKIISYKAGSGNISSLQEGTVEVPQGAHTLVFDYTTDITTNQNFYAYTVVENSKPESLVLVKEQDLFDIANAIRYKLEGIEDTYTPSEMAPAIDLIDTDVFLSSFIKETEPLYSGTIGTCRWEISRKGVLFIHGGELPEPNTSNIWINGGSNYNRWNVAQKKDITETLYWSYWYNYRQYIRLIIIDEPVEVQTSIMGLFGGLDSLWLVLGFENINTSNVIDMRGLFRNCTNLTAIDFSQNDFSNVKYFDLAFNSCSQLRAIEFPSNMQSVESLQSMFNNCSLLVEVDLTSIGDGRNLTTFHYTFNECQNLIHIYQNFSNLKKLSVLNYAFYNCKKLEELDCSNWETTSVLCFARFVFANCSSLKNINLSKLNLSGVTISLEAFFDGCTSLEKVETGAGWVITKDVPFGNFWRNCPAEIDTTYWDVSARTSLASFFANWKGSNQLNLTYWNTSNVTNMSGMFQNCSNLTGIDLFNFDMDNVTNMASMFQGCTSLKWENMTFFDSFETTSRVKNMSNMFNNCVQFTEFVLPFSTYSVTNFTGFLQNCYRLKEVDFSNLILNGSSTSGLPNSSINATDMLTNCGSIRTLVIPQGYDIAYFQNEKSIKFPVNMYSASLEEVITAEDIYIIGTIIPSGGDVYYGCGSLTNGENFNKRIKNFINDDMNNTKTTSATVDSQVRKIIFYATDANMDEDLFDLDFYVAVGDYYNNAGAYAAFDIESGELSVFTPNRLIFFAPNSAKLFASFTGLIEIEFNDITTVRVTDMSYMFQNCKTLPQIDLSTFNTKNVVNMSYMFSGCTYLEEIDLRPLNLYSCTNIRNILEKCTMLNEITFFNQAPRQAFTGQEMFSGCTNLHIFNQPETSSSFVFINLQGAFLNCSSLENLAFPQWAVGALTTCAQMFRYCSSLYSVDISTWELNPTLIKNMAYMFANCINLRRVDFPQDMEPLELNNMEQMFYNCRRLGLDQVGPNGEENYFKLLPLKLKDSVEVYQGSYRPTITVNASYALTGCECIKTLDLSGLEIELNQGFAPTTTYFLSASSGKDGGYLLDKIIMGDNVEMYFYANREFSINKRASAASPDIRYESQTTGEITYDIPANVADTYRVIYPN